VEQPDPKGEFDTKCDYLLRDDLDDHTFVAGGTLINTGNVGIVVKFTARWTLLGGDPVTTSRTVRVRRAKRRTCRYHSPRPVTRSMLTRARTETARQTPRSSTASAA
jgi:hypothetical protein